MDSIIQSDRDKCYICGKCGHMDEHHVFNGCNRKLSEKYGVKVYLCHIGCHMYGPNAVHSNPAIARELKKRCQLIAMKHYGWDEDRFRKIFGKSYL
jgi:hypothetical protein